MEEQQQIIWYRTNDPADVWREGVLVGCDPDVKPLEETKP